ncbi:hypothetical protein V1506DRAFT_533617 [Lipomyces tetrasporus]
MATMFAFGGRYSLKHRCNRFQNYNALFTNRTHVRDWQLLHFPQATSETNRRRITLACLPEFTESDATSNAVPDSVPPHTSLWECKNLSWIYAKALDLLKKNPPEQRIDIHLPYSLYLKLEESWSRFKVEANILEDQKYPRLSYNPVEQIATVVTIQRALHEVAAIEFGYLITRRVREYLGNHKPDEEWRIFGSGSTTRKSSLGKYAKSSKEPDGSFMYADKDHGRVLQLVTEVGLSEHYAALLRDKDMWIQGHNVKAVVLICVNESPRFESPKAAYDIKNVTVELATMRESNTVMQRDMEGGIYGPIEYRGHRWFGKFNAFIEVWRADRKDPIRTVSRTFWVTMEPTSAHIRVNLVAD